jgi:hypothetical protein
VGANAPSLEIPLRFQLYQEPHTAEWEDAWLRFEAVLREFSHSLSDKNVAWAIMSVPAGQVVNDKSWQAILENHPVMADSKWDVLGPEQRLAAFAKDQQILHLQPNAEFQQAAKQAPLFFGDVGHFTTEGHAVMAGSLVKFLKDHATGLIQ